MCFKMQKLTVDIVTEQDEAKAKQLVNFALGDDYSDSEPYTLEV